jgi:4-hydroxy-tetrahydrodipicolinate reductase
VTVPIDIAVAGALGRMGQAVTKAVSDRDDVRLAARFDRPGAQAEGLVSIEEALEAAQVAIDFTTPAASVALARAAAERGGPALVIGSTGFSEDDIAAIAEAARSVAIVRAGNFSLGVNMLMGLVAQAARALGPDAYDIEIFEAHHRRKVDAPSGTALMLGEAAASGRNVNLAEVSRHVRDGVTGPRRRARSGFRCCAAATSSASTR